VPSFSVHPTSGADNEVGRSSRAFSHRSACDNSPQVDRRISDPQPDDSHCFNPAGVRHELPRATTRTTHSARGTPLCVSAGLNDGAAGDTRRDAQLRRRTNLRNRAHCRALADLREEGGPVLRPLSRTEDSRWSIQTPIRRNMATRRRASGPAAANRSSCITKPIIP
jgi:hypothetical protein